MHDSTAEPRTNEAAIYNDTQKEVVRNEVMNIDETARIQIPSDKTMMTFPK
jgi:hypothetical protein